MTFKFVFSLSLFSFANFASADLSKPSLTKNCAFVEGLSQIESKFQTESRTNSQLTSALENLKWTKRGTSMSASEFLVDIQQVFDFMVGKVSGENLTTRFYSSKSKKIEISQTLQKLPEYEGDTIKGKFEKVLKDFFEILSFEGKTVKEARREFNSAREVFILTHQSADLQPKTAKILEDNSAFKNIPALWLLGPESSDPLLFDSPQRVTLARYSVGGEMDIKLADAEVVYLAGGALDSCLGVTLHDVIRKTTSKNLTVRFVKQLTYIDPDIMSKDKQQTIAEFLQVDSDKNKIRGRKQLLSMLETNHGARFRLDEYYHKSTASVVLGQTIKLRHSDRRISLEFIEP